ncbi:MAG: hypothetical protein GY760_03400, partial [Deltaproteobacteria bacterium]|nr:hypothetical protein [Deltaproteobacteria bacterium]
KFSEIDEHLPLRGHLKCKKCGRTMTGSASRGGSGIRHFYYHCQPKCKERFRADEANIIFEELLSEFVIKEDVLVLYKELLNNTFNGEKKSRELRVRQIKLELNKLAVRMESIEDKFFDDIIEASTYNAMKRKTQKKINDLKIELSNIKNLDKDIEEYLKLGISFLHGIDKLYKSSPSNIKKKIVGSIFPEKIVFLKKTYRTDYLDSFIELILSKHKPFKRLKIKTPRQNGKVSSKAPLLGLEPRTL